ncbi:MAG TPA: SIS domain-containing protein [Ktedonobacteraceae bacterium]|nr:SIS domain-containing protein [Ktedonobacteraceae bacterium]
MFNKRESDLKRDSAYFDLLATDPKIQKIVQYGLIRRESIWSSSVHQSRLCPSIITAGGLLLQTYRSGRKILIAGNGGSAAESQHFAAELVGRFKRDRRPLAALSLNTDTSIMTAISNDYGYEEVFARQLRALGQPGDLFFAISVSGYSANIISAVQEAKRRDILSIALTGQQGNPLENIADFTITTLGDDTPLVQEMHLTIIHILCDIIEEHYCD